MVFNNNPMIANRFMKNGKVGVLKEGYYADVIIVDYKAPTPLNESNINGHLLFGISGRNIDTTIINGKIIMDERILIGIDEEAITAKSVELAQKVWNRI